MQENPLTTTGNDNTVVDVVDIISPPPVSTTATNVAVFPPTCPTTTTTARVTQPPSLPPKTTAASTTNDNTVAEAEATATLLKTLRETRAELDLATALKLQAENRCAVAQRAYDHCVHLLSGYNAAPLTMTGRKNKKKSRYSDDYDDALSGMEAEDGIRKDYKVGENNSKRVKASTILPTSGTTIIERPPMTTTTVTAAAAAAADLSTTTMMMKMRDDPSSLLSTTAEATEPQHSIISILAETTKTSHFPNTTTAALPLPSSQQLIIPTNPLHHPPNYNSIISTGSASSVGNIMSPSTLHSFRNSFYHTLTKGAISNAAANIHTWQPSPNNANLKSRSQLMEWIHVVQHWNTGANGLDVGAFRAKHKTFYSRMKPASCNLGRRTGMHLREINNNNNDDDDDDERKAGDGSGSGGKSSLVLCRYNKAGNKSIMYLEVCRLFDALFEIHVIELSHRGRDATKNLADERYANIPDGTVRAFLDNCPICNARRSSDRGGGHGSSFVDEGLAIDDEYEEEEEEEEDVRQDDVHFSSKTHSMDLQLHGESTSLQGVQCEGSQTV